MNERFAWAEPTTHAPVGEQASAPQVALAQPTVLPRAVAASVTHPATTLAWSPVLQYAHAPQSQSAQVHQGALAPMYPSTPRHVAAAPVLPMSRRDGAIGLTIGLVLLVTTLSGSVALGFLGRPSAPATPAPAAASAAPVAATTAPVTADAVGAVPGGVPPTGADPIEAGPVGGPAVAGGGANTPAKATGAKATATHAATKQAKVAGQATRGGGAHAVPATTRPRPAAQSNTSGQGGARPSTPHPASTGGGGAAPHPAAATAAPAVAPAAATPAPVAIAPVPAVVTPAPETRAPVSYSVSTPGGAHWTSPASEYDAIKNGVPNATMTPNY